MVCVSQRYMVSPKSGGRQSALRYTTALHGTKLRGKGLNVLPGATEYALFYHCQTCLSKAGTKCGPNTRKKMCERRLGIAKTHRAVDVKGGRTEPSDPIRENRHGGSYLVFGDCDCTYCQPERKAQPRGVASEEKAT